MNRAARHLTLKTSMACLSLSLALFCGAGSAEQDSPLGSLQSGIVTSPEEQAMGREFIAAARKQLVFIDDPLLTEYVSALGQRLSRGLVGDTDSLRFFLIDSPMVNAFAGPGSRMAVFTGLVTATQTEAELASVVAHELGHVAQRHLPRMMERSRQRKLPTTAAMLAGILLGGQVGAAAMAATSGAAVADQLNYNREYEREADVLGLRILTDAGYPASATIQFLKRLDQETRLQSSGAPEYLRTHPLTQNRIALVESRIRQYPDFAEPPSLDFYHARVRIQALYGAGGADSVLANFTHHLDSTVTIDARAARYGQVLTLIRFGNYDEAIKRASDLHRDFPGDVSYRLAWADALLQSGQVEDAVSHLETLALETPESTVVAYYFADALMKAGRFEVSRKVLRRAIRAAPSNAFLYRLMARVEGEAGNLPQSFQALAEYYFLQDEVSRAIGALQHASTLVSDNAYLEASITSKISELEALQPSKP